MRLDQVQKNIVDLRHSEFDESELDALKAKKKQLEKKAETATTKKPEYEKQIEAVAKEIEELERETEQEKRAGRARFSRKTIIDYRTKGRRPPYWFTWVRYSPNSDPPYREFTEWVAGGEYTPVKYGKDPFYPVGATVNQSGYWQFKDAVWIKTDLKEYLLKKIAEQKQQTGGEELIRRLEKQWDAEDQYMAAKKFRSLEDMERRLQDDGIDDDILRSIGL